MCRLLSLVSVLLCGIAVLAGPDNDDFANRQQLLGTNVQFTVYRLDATRELDEPRHTAEGDALVGHASVWFTWRAPMDGWVRLTESFSSELLAVVYHGEQIEALVPVIRSSGRVSLKFAVSAGESYQIAASQRWSDEPPPTGQRAFWNLQFFTAPANDMFANRFKVTDSTVLLQAHTVNATREPGEPLHADVAIPSTIWWEWTPPFSGPVSIAGAPSFAGRVRVYQGTGITSLQPLPMPETFHRFEVTAGVPVQVAVGPYAQSIEGPVDLALVLSPIRIVSPQDNEGLEDGDAVRFVLTNVPPGVSRITAYHPQYQANVFGSSSELVVTNVAPGKYIFEISAFDEANYFEYFVPPIAITVRPGSDALADAREVTPADRKLGGDFALATLEGGEPPAATGIQGSLWWRWTAPTNGNVLLDSGAFQGRIARDVFTTNEVGELEAVPTDSAGQPGAQRSSFNAEVGRTYFIRLWQLPQTGPLDWAATGFQFQPIAPNDNIINAIDLPVDGVGRILAREFTTCEPGEAVPCDAGTGSRWYKLATAANGRLNVALTSWFSVEHQTSISLYRGDPGALTLVAPAALSHSIYLEPANYYIRVQTPNEYSEGIDISLAAHFAVIPPNDDAANAIPIPTPDGMIYGSTYLATDDGEPPQIAGEQSLWYRFKAPHEGTLVARVARTESSPQHYIPQVSFARGTLAATLTWADEQSRWGDVAAIDLSTDEEILVSVWANHFSGEPNLEFTFEHNFVPRPANDDFADRILLEGESFQFRATNWNATTEVNEPAGSVRTKSVWWEWVAPESGTLEFIKPPTGLDLFTGTPTNLVFLSMANDERQLAGGAAYSVNSGQHYFIRVSRGDTPIFPSPGFPDFEMNLQLSSWQLKSPTNGSVYIEGQPIHLEAIGPTNLSGLPHTATFVRATNQQGAARPIVLGSVSEEPYRLLLTNLFPGHHLFHAVITNSSGQTSRTATARVRIAPANDQLTNAFVLSGRQMEGVAIISGATRTNDGDIGEGAVWYQWTPSTSGRIRWSAFPAYNADLFYSTNAPNKITNVTNLRSVGRLNNSAAFNVFPSSNYWIRIQGPTNGLGTFIASRFKLEHLTTSFTAPANGTVYSPGAVVPIRLTTTEQADQISGVDLFHGTNLLTRLTAADNYEYLWTNPPVGVITLAARPVVNSGEPVATVTNSFVVRVQHDFSQTPLLLAETLGSIRGNWDSATGTNANAPKDLWYQWSAPADGVLAGRFTNNISDRDLELYAPVETTNGVAWNLVTNFNVWSGSGTWRVTSGSNYLLAVSGPSDARGEFEVLLEFAARSANDQFTNRIAFSGTGGEVRSRFALATLEVGEPEHSGFGQPALGSIWYTWTPPTDGLIAISSENEATRLAAVRLWNGSAVNALTAVSNAPGWGTWFGGPAYYVVRSGVPVQISVATTSEIFAEVPWSWEFLEAPINDNFAESIPVRGARLTVEGTTVGATREEFEGTQFTSTVWWSWTSDANGFVRLNVSDSPGVEGRAYLSKTPETFDSWIPVWSHVTNELPVKAGDVVHLQIVTEHFLGRDFMLFLEMSGTAENDDFAAAQRFNGTNVQWFADNRLATREFREPNHAGEFGGRSLWYQWKAERTGTVEIRRTGYSEYLLVAVYQGNNVASLTNIASMFMVEDRVLRFEAAAGQEYAIAIDNASGYSGATSLELVFTRRLEPASLQVVLGENGSLEFTGPASSSDWLLEESADLIEWQEVSGEWNIEPGSNPGPPARFYRLRSR